GDDSADARHVLVTIVGRHDGVELRIGRNQRDGIPALDARHASPLELTNPFAEIGRFHAEDLFALLVMILGGLSQSRDAPNRLLLANSVELDDEARRARARRLPAAGDRACLLLPWILLGLAVRVPGRP